MDKIDSLIDLLFDETASISERDDAAMDLGGFNDKKVQDALENYTTNPPNNIEIIMNSCGESLAELWVKNNKFKSNIYVKLHPVAKYAFISYFKAWKPEWLELMDKEQ